MDMLWRFDKGSWLLTWTSLGLAGLWHRNTYWRSEYGCIEENSQGYLPHLKQLDLVLWRELKRTLLKRFNSMQGRNIKWNKKTGVALYRAKPLRFKIVILEILPCIPAVTIFAFFELEQIFSFVDGH